MKRLFSAALLVLSFLTVILILPQAARSQWPPVCQERSLPSHDPKYPQDQLIIICIPPDWNGQLVMYAHGYVAPQLPLSLPVNELTVDGVFIPSAFIAQRFAFATTSFHKNGVAIEQGGEDLNRLLREFKSMVPPGSLDRVYIVGGSEGGLIAVRLLEHFPGNYSGGLAVCAPLGGSSAFLKNVYDFRVVFDYFFPSVFTYPPNQPGEQPFGAFGTPQDAFLFWQSVYVPRIIAALTGNLLATLQLFSVTKAVVDPTDPTTAIETALSLLAYPIFGANDLITTAGGIPYDNRSTTYRGSANDAALNAGVERIQSDERARAYARRFYEPTGNLHDPLVTLHNLFDPLVPFQHEIEYSFRVAKKRRSELLAVQFSSSYGHCEFTAEEVIQAFTLMVQQVGEQLVNVVGR
jgi:pimeloyl-ACP methyl ester carboxylesterase